MTAARDQQRSPEALLHVVDWLPTFLELAGADAHAVTRRPLDGTSAVETLQQLTSSQLIEPPPPPSPPPPPPLPQQLQRRPWLVHLAYRSCDGAFLEVAARNDGYKLMLRLTPELAVSYPPAPRRPLWNDSSASSIRPSEVSQAWRWIDGTGGADEGRCLCNLSGAADALAGWIAPHVLERACPRFFNIDADESESVDLAASAGDSELPERTAAVQTMSSMCMQLAPILAEKFRDSMRRGQS